MPHDRSKDTRPVREAHLDCTPLAATSFHFDLLSVAGSHGASKEHDGGNSESPSEQPREKKPRLARFRGQVYDRDHWEDNVRAAAGLPPISPNSRRAIPVSPPSAHNAYGFAPGREIAAGVLKRLLLVTALGAPIAGTAYLASRGARSSSAPTKSPPSISQKDPVDLTDIEKGVRNVFKDAREAIVLAEQGLLHPIAIESVNDYSGLASYRFKLRPTEVGEEPDPARSTIYSKEIFLSGVPLGERRDNFLRALQASGISVRRADGSSEQTFGSETSSILTTIVGTVIAVSLVSVAFNAFRSRRRTHPPFSPNAPTQSPHPPNDGTGGLESLARYSGEVALRPLQRFKDIGGLEHVVGQLKELQSDIELTQRGVPGILLPTGLVLYGPPGTGKTALVRALAGESGVPLLQVDGAQLTKLLKGTGPASLAAAFQDARTLRDRETQRLRQLSGASGLEQGVVIMLIDELDSVAGKRAGGGELGDDERQNIVNTMLQEMNGFDAQRNKNVIVVGATNLIEKLDPALLRPGRFTDKIEVPLPIAWQQRLDILKKLEVPIMGARGMYFGDHKALEHLAKISVGKTGDELRSILEESVKIATRAGRGWATGTDLFEAFQRQSFGRIRENFLPEVKREIIAFHEHGHGVVGLACGIKPLVVSMLSRGFSGGRVVFDPQSVGEVLRTQREMLARLLASAGGRAAELEHYGSLGVTEGASMDLDQMRGVVRDMISVGMLDDLYDSNLRTSPSHHVAERHSKIINDMVTNAVEAAKKILRAIGNETMTKLVQDSLDLGRELAGDEAEQFYRDRIPEEAFEMAAQVVESFMKAPRGRAKPQTKGDTTI